MALPLVNVTPKYELNIPSTGQLIRFRPYLVKEEKVLLMAFESKDSRTILRAMLDIIGACIEEDIDLNSLATFDVEFMFLKIRGKSVGETSNVVVKCKHCEADNEVSINLDEVELTASEKSNVIELTQDISIEMKYPSYSNMLDSNIMTEDHTPNASDLINVITQGISAVLTEEERFDAKDYSKEELEAFVDSLTSEQFTKLASFFDDMPQLQHDINFACSSCGEQNSFELSGMADFF